jgi:hypothetical protein
VRAYDDTAVETAFAIAEEYNGAKVIMGQAGIKAVTREDWASAVKELVQLKSISLMVETPELVDARRHLTAEKAAEDADEEQIESLRVKLAAEGLRA